jgi:hypothetical protein
MRARIVELGDQWSEGIPTGQVRDCEDSCSGDDRVGWVV